jgi:predicted nucleic acid-binding protein
MDAFDADVIIYAAEPGHPLGLLIMRLFVDVTNAGQARAGIGSVLLLPEVLSKPRRSGPPREVDRLVELLAMLDLIACDEAIADLAAQFGADFRLRAADAVHLATAVNAGADRFLTNNQRDFPKSIDAIEIVYPEDLA